MKRIFAILTILAVLLSSCSILRPAENFEKDQWENVSGNGDSAEDTENDGSQRESEINTCDIESDTDTDDPVDIDDPTKVTEPDESQTDTDIDIPGIESDIEGEDPIDSVDSSKDTESDSESTVEPEPEVLNHDFFNDAVFIGDSIMEGIRLYTEKMRVTGTMLGKAKFITSIMGISIADLIGERANPVQYRYKGKEQSLDIILDDIKPKKIFLLLGLNDLAMEDNSVEKVTIRYEALIRALRESGRGYEIIVITNTPKISSSWLPDYVLNKNFNNDLINAFVTELIKMCESMSVPYVDAHTVLAVNGALPDHMCSDGYLHLNDIGASLVVDALYGFASKYM